MEAQNAINFVITEATVATIMSQSRQQIRNVKSEDKQYGNFTQQVAVSVVASISSGQRSKLSEKRTEKLLFQLVKITLSRYKFNF